MYHLILHTHTHIYAHIYIHKWTYICTFACINILIPAICWYMYHLIPANVPQDSITMYHLIPATRCNTLQHTDSINMYHLIPANVPRRSNPPAKCRLVDKSPNLRGFWRDPICRRRAARILRARGKNKKTKTQKNRDHTKKSTHSYTLIYMCAPDTLFVVDVLPEYWERGWKWYGVAAISRLLKIMGLRLVGSLKS